MFQTLKHDLELKTQNPTEGLDPKTWLRFDPLTPIRV